jgi:hypothetical protein
MIKQHFSKFVAFFAVAIFMSSCAKDKCTREITYTQFTPIFMAESDMRQDATIVGSKDLKEPGKIYFYNNYIFINELREGIHIIDNTEPSSPQNMGFIEIKGNVDIAVKDNILYADNFMDLLAIDITDPLAPVQLSRQQDVFPILGNDANGNILAYYETEVITETVECNDNRWRGGWLTQVDFASPTAQSAGNASGGGQGVGGSMARFTIVDDFLYTVDNSNLNIFDITNGATPNPLGSSMVGWNIETIFPKDDMLFLGSSNGMFIYDISNRTNPIRLSEFWHVGACDPVFVQDDLAYVTLRSGNICDGFTDQMEVIDISNPSNPTLLKTYPMDNPHGLSIANNTLFLCEGDYGLKVFDVEDHMNIDELEHYKDFSTYDVIALPNNLLLVIGSDGFYQYDYSDVNNLELLSKITVH